MRRISASYTSAAANLTGFASNVTGGSWSLSANNSGDGLAHKLTIRNDSVTNHSAKTVTIVGLDEAGRPQTQTGFAMPNTSATVTTGTFWSRVDSVTPSLSIGADTMDIGWAVDSVTPWLGVQGNGNAPFNISFVVTPSGGSTYTVQSTANDVFAVSHATLTSQTTTQEGNYTTPKTGIRLNFTVAGSATLDVLASHIQ